MVGMEVTGSAGQSPHRGQVALEGLDTPDRDGAVSSLGTEDVSRSHTNTHTHSIHTYMHTCTHRAHTRYTYTCIHTLHVHICNFVAHIHTEVYTLVMDTRHLDS